MSLTSSPLTPGALCGRRVAPAGAGLFARLNGLLALRRQRRALARLDTARLHDIGITVGEARAEAARCLWDVPPGWRA